MNEYIFEIKAIDLKYSSSYVPWKGLYVPKQISKQVKPFCRSNHCFFGHRMVKKDARIAIN